MFNSFEIINENNYDIDSFEITKLLEYALKKEKVNNAIFNVIFVDDNEIKKINQEYRNIDKSTDVISFALEDSEDEEFLPIRVLGDIYISYETAKRQAIDYKHSLKREISFLTVHGLLHLLGYDHMNETDEKEMFGRQEEILNELKIER